MKKFFKRLWNFITKFTFLTDGEIKFYERLDFLTRRLESFISTITELRNALIDLKNKYNSLKDKRKGEGVKLRKQIKEYEHQIELAKKNINDVENEIKIMDERISNY